MPEFVTDYNSIITLADVPHAAICEDITKRHVHKLVEGLNTKEWLLWILQHNKLKGTVQTTIRPPDCLFCYYLTVIDGVDHYYSVAKKDGKMWAVAEEVDMSWYNKE